MEGPHPGTQKSDFLFLSIHLSFLRFRCIGYVQTYRHFWSTPLTSSARKVRGWCGDCECTLTLHLCFFAANIVSEATGSLQMKLQEAGGSHPSPSPSSPSTPGHTGPSQEMRKGGVVVEEPASRVVACAGESSGEISRQQQQQPTVEQDLQARVLCIGQQAMDG